MMGSWNLIFRAILIQAQMVIIARIVYDLINHLLALLHRWKHLFYPHFIDVFEGILSVYRNDCFLRITL